MIELKVQGTVLVKIDGSKQLFTTYLLYLLCILPPPHVPVFKTDTETFLTIDRGGEVLILRNLSTTANIF